MFSKNKSKETLKFKYILLTSVLMGMLIYTSCENTEKNGAVVKEKIIKSERKGYLDMSLHGDNPEGKIVYQVSLNTELYVLQLMYDTEMSDFLRNVRLQEALESRPMNFFLLFDNNESLYHAEFDMNMQRDMGLGMNLTGIEAGEDYICYSSLKTKENFRQSFWMDNIIINVKPIVWKLTKETKKIDEYTCYKATATLTEEKENGGYLSDFIVAWYTNQIPVPFGIQNFGGLPGLTLELTQYTERGTLFYKATNIELNSKDNIIIKKPKGKGISHKEFIERISRTRKK